MTIFVKSFTRKRTEKPCAQCGVIFIGAGQAKNCPACKKQKIRDANRINQRKFLKKKKGMSIKKILSTLTYLDKLLQDVDKNGSGGLPAEIINQSAEIHELTEGLSIFGKIVRVEALQQRLKAAKIQDDWEAVNAVEAELNAVK